MKTEKRCFKCERVKPLTDFYKHHGMKDGRLNKCKECNKLDAKSNRKKNIEYYREYDSLRGSRQDYEYTKSYRKKFPMKYAAHKLTGNAVRDGRIVKPDNCEECGSSHRSIHGHHDDYAKALDVRWLCPPCHKEWHRANGEAKNAS